MWRSTQEIWACSVQERGTALPVKHWQEWLSCHCGLLPVRAYTQRSGLNRVLLLDY
jgi:hypothetical protein